MKHTIKLLTLAFMLATILTLTGCPGPVNNSPVVPEYTITVNVTHGTAETVTNGTPAENPAKAKAGDTVTITVNVTHGTAEIVTNGTPAENPAKAKAGDTVTITATAEEGFIFDGASSAFNIPDCSLTSDGTVITWNFSMFTEDVVINVTFKQKHIWEEITTDETKAATCTEDGLAVYKCSRCDETKTENIPAHHTFIAGGCDKCGAYEHNKEDDYQIMAYVYSSEDDAKKGENETVLYFSFPNDTTGIPQIVTINAGLAINLNDLIQMKSGYAGKTVKYFTSSQIKLSQIDCFEYLGDPKPLTLLEEKDITNTIVLPIYIVIE